MVNLLGSKGKIPLEDHRLEIEERTLNGDSCETIAEALRSNHGLEVSYKTISRKRVDWGLRRRVKRSENDEAQARRVARKVVPSKHSNKTKRQLQNKEEITARTQRGETAEQIAAELIAQGATLSKGVQTILRLQTFWGLVDPDINKMKGKKTEQQLEDRKAAREATKAAKKAAAKEAKERAVPANQSNEIIHYPGNCRAGPGQLSSRSLPDAPPLTGGRDANDPVNIQRGLGDSDDNDDWDPLPAMEKDNLSDHSMGSDASQQAEQPGTRNLPTYPTQQLDYSREIMSAELMVDLANSMLMAANNVKDTLVAAQEQRPVLQSSSRLPPSVDEIMLTRRKLKEATRCAWDLAKDGILDDV